MSANRDLFQRREGWFEESANTLAFFLHSSTGGHAVLRTLIRCHFSPLATTGQQYVYSGSADGKIHIWSLDGQIVQVLDRSKAQSIYADPSMNANDPSAAEFPDPSTQGGNGLSADEIRTRSGNAYRNSACTVRDVSWHSSEPSMMSTAWDGPDGERGSIAKHVSVGDWARRGEDGNTTRWLTALPFPHHPPTSLSSQEWKGYGKNGLSLEDAIARTEAEDIV